VIAGLVVVAAFAGCGETSSEPAAAPASEDPGPVHVHGLGVDPADGSLFIATHTGLFRAGPNEARARRVGRSYQDTMGFTVVGPNRFLGSGHPDASGDLPPFLGLIASRDAGKTWDAIALQGEVDFHVLEANGRRIYGYGSDWETRQPRFLTSENGGRSWQPLQAPGSLISLAISPDDPRALVASSETGVFRSDDAGRSWAKVDAPAAGFVVWISDGLILVGLDGRVLRATDLTGGSWRPLGSIDAQPAAVDTGAGRELLVALHDGSVKRSVDGGATWDVRSSP